MVDSTPNPSPSRANYGFALYLASYSLFALYMIWMLLPEHILEFIGITFLPQKYWSLAVPIHACVTLTFMAFIFYPALNLTLVPKTNDMCIITDQYAKYTENNTDSDGVPTVSDLPLTEVCEKLFLCDYDYSRFSTKCIQERL